MVTRSSSKIFLTKDESQCIFFNYLHIYSPTRLKISKVIDNFSTYAHKKTFSLRFSPKQYVHFRPSSGNTQWKLFFPLRNGLEIPEKRNYRNYSRKSRVCYHISSQPIISNPRRLARTCARQSNEPLQF